MAKTGKNVTVPDADDDGDLPDARGNRTQGWVQTDKKAHQAMWQLGIKHPMALSVLHFMVSRLNRGTNGVIISAAALAKQMGISPRTVQSTITVLRDCKFVQVLKTGNTNVYIINAHVAWQGERGSRFAHFNAEITIDEQEQEKPVDELIEQAYKMLPVPIMEFDEKIDLGDAQVVMPEDEDSTTTQADAVDRQGKLL
ncbi:replication/maintenance protein RepL [Massilia sp. CCM 9210]|uniref:replication/maintenance protein RepL n=1 Tax=Massilia scottii TaxID=3057166 RepID=UPI0027964EC0|nr:replication/maintenance protein RepL [Massilia sp. CCM 9210]MDQ1817807.1 replication/maintenance protein RepL [Massilia sp. CCM 9210]